MRLQNEGPDDEQDDEDDERHGDPEHVALAENQEFLVRDDCGLQVPHVRR